MICWTCGISADSGDHAQCAAIRAQGVQAKPQGD